MKPQFIAIAAVLVAAGVGLTATPRLLPAERQVAATEIDFTVLHRQASDALNNLRELQASRRAALSPAVF